jgi:hypothetical protein
VAYLKKSKITCLVAFIQFTRYNTWVFEEELVRIYGLNIEARENEAPWRGIATGLWEPDSAPLLFGERVPDEVLEALAAADPVGHVSGFVEAHVGNTRYRASFYGANALRGVRSWLERNHCEFTGVGEVGDASITLNLRLGEGVPRRMHMNWDLLRDYNEAQVAEYLDSNGFAKRLQHDDIYIGRP